MSVTEGTLENTGDVDYRCSLRLVTQVPPKLPLAPLTADTSL